MTTMTSQHFNFIADTLKGALATAEYPQPQARESWREVESVAYRFARELARTNPGFDPDRFLRACGVED